MSTYPQWLLKTQERIFIGFVADIHKLDISHQCNDSLTSVKFSGRHQQSNVCSTSLIIHTHKTMTSPTESL